MESNNISIIDRYYIGDAKKLFKIQNLINDSDLPKEAKYMIIEEYNKISLSNQVMRHELIGIIKAVNNITKQ